MVGPRKAASAAGLALLAACAALVIVQHLGAGRVALESEEMSPMVSPMGMYQVDPLCRWLLGWGMGLLVARARAPLRIARHTAGMTAPVVRLVSTREGCSLTSTRSTRSTAVRWLILFLCFPCHGL